MKRLWISFICLFLICNISYAKSTSTSISVEATIKDSLELSVDLREDLPGYPDITNDTLMDFGVLVPEGDGRSLVADTGIVAFISVNSHRLPYTLYSEINIPLTCGVYELPKGSTTVNSVCVDGDQPFGKCEGFGEYSGTSIGKHIIYRSGGKHRAGVIRSHYMIGTETYPGGTDYVPIDQYPGRYRERLVITVVT